MHVRLRAHTNTHRRVHTWKCVFTECLRQQVSEQVTELVDEVIDMRGGCIVRLRDVIILSVSQSLSQLVQ